MPKKIAKPLTHAAVHNLRYKKSGPRIQRLWDTAVPGLGLEVFPSQRKSWVFRYRIGERQRIITLGNAADYDLDAARDKAVEARGQVRSGDDPKLMRDAPSDAITVKQLWEQYRTTPYFQTRSADFQRGMTSTIENYVLPELGHLAVTAVKRWQIRRAVDALIADGREGAARGLLSRTRILFNFALERELIENSPADHIKPRYTTTGNREVWLQTIDELRGAWFLDASIQVRLMVRWLLLTGCRRDEARTAAWAQIDGEVWRVPATKNNRTLALPIMPMMAEALEESKATWGPTHWIFPATTSNHKPMHRASWDYALRKATAGRWSAHVLRHTVESHLRELGIVEESRDAVLNHARRSTGSRYGHGEQLERKRAALGVWHDHLLKVVSRPE